MHDFYERLIVVGDIHGMLDEFLQLLKATSYNPDTDFVISVGDLVDKGPQTTQVLDWFMENPSQVIMGNHESKFMRWLKGNPVQITHGLEETIKSLQERTQTSELRKKYLEFISNLPNAILLEPYNVMVVHAGLLPPYTVEAQRKHSTMLRYVDADNRFLSLGAENTVEDALYWPHRYTGPLPVLFGHQPHQDVHIYHNKAVALDTGACYGGSLSAAILRKQDLDKHGKEYTPEKFEYVSVPARKITEWIKPSQVSY